MPVRAVLELRSTGYLPRAVLLTGARVRIGRGPRCEVRLQGDGVSDVYCTLRRRGGGWSIEPHSPHVPVVLEGIRIHQSVALPAETMVLVGNDEFRLRLEVMIGSTFKSCAEGRPIECVARVLESVRPESIRLNSSRARSADVKLARPPAVMNKEKSFGATWGKAVPNVERRAQESPPHQGTPSVTIPTDKEASHDHSGNSSSAVFERRTAAFKSRYQRASGDPPALRRTGVDPCGADPDTQNPQPQACPTETAETLALRELPTHELGHESSGWLGHSEFDPRCPSKLSHECAPITSEFLDLRALQEYLQHDEASSDDDASAAPLSAASTEASPHSEPENSKNTDARGRVSEPVETSRLEELPSTASNWTSAEALSELDPGTRELGSDALAPTPRGFPSAQEILHSCGYVGSTTERLMAVTRRVDTGLSIDSSEPRVLHVPLWVILPPVLVLALIGCGGGMALAWVWAGDARTAANLANHSDMEDGQALSIRALNDTLSWWSTTADHLYERACVLHNQARDQADLDAAKDLLDLAEHASPTNALVRLAHAVGGDVDTITEKPASQDVLSLGQAARQALTTGQRELALHSMRTGIALATRSEPQFDRRLHLERDKATHRYRLPGEELYNSVLAPCIDFNSELLDHLVVDLPSYGVAWLALYRLLHESGSPAASGVLERILALPDEQMADISPGLHRAAKAEVLAISGRSSDAVASYYAAIKLVEDRGIQLVLWCNLSEIATAADDSVALLEARREVRELIKRLRLRGFKGELSRRHQ